MSDASFAVTYTSVYTDSEPWRYYKEESAKAGSLRVIDLSTHHLLITYPVLSTHPHLSRYHTYPSRSTSSTVPSDAEAPLEDQPLPVNSLPIAASPGFVADSDPDKDLEEDPEDNHVDYPADGGDGNDDPSDDNDTDDEDEEALEDEEDDEEEEEHLALTDSSAVPIVDHVLPARDTKALEADEPAPIPRSPHTIIPLSQTR
nr:hypothetical protein [Tanacetum cinerariifolium]